MSYFILKFRNGDTFESNDLYKHKKLHHLVARAADYYADDFFSPNLKKVFYVDKNLEVKKLNKVRHSIVEDYFENMVQIAITSLKEDGFINNN